MFRKIHSNRNPQDTVLNQLRKEFSPYFEKASKKITQNLQKNPKVFFAAMVILIFVSAGLCFTVLRNKAPAAKQVKTVRVNTVSDGFSQILSTAAGIKQGLALKHQIDSLSLKKTLSKTDSQTLINDLDKLHQLNKPYHP